MSANERAWVALGLALTLHPRLKTQFRAAQILADGEIEAVERRLEKALSLRPRGSRDIFSRNFPEWADNQIRASRDAGVAIVTYEQAAYPAGLRHLTDPPPFIYVKGMPLPPDGAAVAVVGSRKATPYGVRVAERLGRDLASSGVAVVSGLARGIDTAAHRGALSSEGRTVGVLGSGIDVVYPKENRRLFESIPSSGCLVTEYPFGMPPHPHHFPVRNRLIAALSAMVVVVEAARDSGSLITAKLACDELGRPVGAVPGPVTSATSEGCNDLIYDGAPPIRDARDVLELLPSSMRRAPVPARSGTACGMVGAGTAEGLDREARRVLGTLSADEPSSADDLAARLGLASGALLGHLLELELRGLARQLPGGLYVRSN